MSSLSASGVPENPGHTKPNVKQCYFISIQFVIFANLIIKMVSSELFL